MHPAHHLAHEHFILQILPLQYLVGVPDGLHRQPLQPFGMLVDRKDIYIDATLLENPVIAIVFIQHRTAVSQLGILEEIVFVRLPALQRHRFIQFVGQNLNHLQIILPKHLHIHIIIPGNKTLMAGCTNQCAAYQPVTDVMALADGIKSQQQLYHPLLMLPQQRTFGIKPGSQLLITILSCLIFHHIHLFFL